MIRSSGVCITSYELFPGVADYVSGFLFCNPRNGLCFEAIPEEIYTVELAKETDAICAELGFKIKYAEPAITA